MIANHRYLAPNAELAAYNYAQDDVVVEAQDFDRQQRAKRGEKQSIYEKSLGQECDKVVTRDFLKKYIAYAKSQKAPEITPDAIELASNAYATFRTKNLNMQTSMPITVRTLESIIRLATAHAKLRLSKTVDMNDIDVAMTLMNEALFLHREEKAEAPEDCEDEEMYDEDETQLSLTQSNRSQRYATRRGDVLQEESPKKPAASNKRAKRDEQQPSPAKENALGARPTKRLRTEEATPAKEKEATPAKEAQEIKQLMTAAPKTVDLQAKKFLYKLMTEHKDPSDKIGVDLLYKKYMMAPDQDVLRRGKALIKDKREMLEIIEEMERENLVMYAPEDGQVVII